MLRTGKTKSVETLFYRRVLRWGRWHFLSIFLYESTLLLIRNSEFPVLEFVNMIEINTLLLIAFLFTSSKRGKKECDS